MTQEVKIEFKGNESFFFAHSFKTALEHAEEFIARNKGEHEIKVYTLSERPVGERWRLYKVIPPVVPTSEVEGVCYHKNYTSKFSHNKVDRENRPVTIVDRYCKDCEIHVSSTYYRQVVPIPN